MTGPTIPGTRLQRLVNRWRLQTIDDVEFYDRRNGTRVLTRVPDASMRMGVGIGR